MPNKKTKSIADSRQINYTPGAQEKRDLAVVERHIMMMDGIDDCVDVSNARILRYLVTLGAKKIKQRKKRVPKILRDDGYNWDDAKY